MIIDCVADLHGYLPDMAGGDLLIVAGDLTARDSPEGYMAFLSWLKKLPYRCKVVVAGNHDGMIEAGAVTIASPEENIHYLMDSGIEFEGLKLWGSPFTPTFGAWHFMCNRGEEIKKHWDLIPAGIDILITHGPPYGIFDRNILGQMVGCVDLRDAVHDRVKPRLHCFGHIHEWGSNRTEIDGTTYINCSYVDVAYCPVHKPVRMVL